MEKEEEEEEQEEAEVTAPTNTDLPNSTNSAMEVHKDKESPDSRGGFPLTQLPLVNPWSVC